MYRGQKVNAIVQARMTSTRLPRKVLLPLAGKPVLQHIIERLRQSKYIDEVIIACTDNEADNPIIELCDKLECKYYRGSEDDVLDRVLKTAREFDTDIIVEITADCPCVDWNIADDLIEYCVKNFLDYASNVIERTFPRGLDVQVFTLEALETVNELVNNPIDRQHVSSYIYLNPEGKEHFTRFSHVAKEDLSNIRLTLDTLEDYEVLKKIFEMYKDYQFTYKDIIVLYKQNQCFFEANKDIKQKDYFKELETWQSTKL